MTSLVQKYIGLWNRPLVKYIKQIVRSFRVFFEYVSFAFK
jgi:hypothetical protein